MSVNLRVKNGRYYLDIYFQGQRKWESTGLSTSADPQQNKEVKRLAEVLRSKREQQVVSGEWGLLDPIGNRKSLVSYAEHLAKDQPLKYPLPKSLKYLRIYAKNISIGSITEKWVDGYRSFLLEQKVLSPATAAKYLSALNGVFIHAIRDRLISRNPAEGAPRIKVPETMKVHLELLELEKLAGTPLGGELGAEIRLAFLFAAFTGLRISDLRALAWGEIQRAPLQIFKVMKKTGRVVTIPLHETAWAIINDSAIHRREEPVFPRLSTTTSNTNQYLRQWALNARVDKDIGWHTARHTFAVRTLEGGADFYTVSKLLGHTKPQTTAVYARATDGMKRKAMEGLQGIEIPAPMVKKVAE